MHSESVSYEFLRELTSTYGPSFQLIWEERLSSNFQRLSAAFRAEYPATRISYSYKTNYVPNVCKAIHALGGMAEVVSAMEWEMALAYGVPPSAIIYNGPNKSRDSLVEALTRGALVQLDSRRDWEMVKEIRDANQDGHISFGVRVNFELKPGEISRFGIDVDGPLFEEIVTAVADDDKLSLRGLHCHFPDRDVESFRTRVNRLTELSERVFAEGPPEYLNLGGGFSGELGAEIARRLGVSASSYRDYAHVVGGRMRSQFDGRETHPQLIIEPGTAVVADAMSFVTTVIDIREVRGRRIAGVDGSLYNISPHARTRRLPVRAVADRQVQSNPACDIVGFTCIESDVLTVNAPLDLRVGDLLIYDNVGSYSIVMKPPFILPSPPILWVSASGQIELIRRRETTADILATYLEGV